MSLLRDEYTDRLKLQLDDLSANIDVMDAKMQAARAEVRAVYRSELARLRLQSQEAGDKLDAVKAGGEAQWDKTVLEMDRVRDAVVHSYNYFKAQF